MLTAALYLLDYVLASCLAGIFIGRFIRFGGR